MSPSYRSLDVTGPRRQAIVSLPTEPRWSHLVWTGGLQLGQALLAITIVGIISMSMCFAALRGRIKSG